MRALCEDCFLDGNFYLHLNVTKLQTIPSVQLDLTGTVDSNIDVSVTAGPREDLTEATKDFYRKSLRKVDIPNVATVGKYLLLS